MQLMGMGLMFKGRGMIAGVLAGAAAGGWIACTAQPAIIGFKVGREIGRMEGARQAAARRRQPLSPQEQGPVGSGR